MIIIMLSIVGTSYDGHCPSSCLFHLANKHHTHTHTHTHTLYAVHGRTSTCMNQPWDQWPRGSDAAPAWTCSSIWLLIRCSSSTFHAIYAGVVWPSYQPGYMTSIFLCPVVVFVDREASARDICPAAASYVVRRLRLFTVGHRPARDAPVVQFLAGDVIYTSRAYAMMPVRLSVCLWRKCIGAL